MQTFDQSLMALLNQGLISYEEAMRQSSNPDDFALRFSGVSSTSDTTWDAFEVIHSHKEEKNGKDVTPPQSFEAKAASAPRTSTVTKKS
jgi:twitching motility protein PilT